MDENKKINKSQAYVKLQYNESENSLYQHKAVGVKIASVKIIELC